MRVPCDLIWVGPDGTVQMCYVTFRLGNLHTQRLSEMLYRPEHKYAARGAYELRCPNCQGNYDPRVAKHLSSRFKYSHHLAKIAQTPQTKLTPEIM
jgi:cyclic pyranopterin phosphate synthase